MKTTAAIAAKLFEPATTQTTRTTSASTGSAVDFSSLIASVRSQGMVFAQQDDAQLISTPAERPAAPAPRQTAAETNRSTARDQVKARDTESRQARKADDDVSATDETRPATDSAPAAAAADRSATADDDDAAKDTASQTEAPVAADTVAPPVITIPDAIATTVAATDPALAALNTTGTASSTGAADADADVASDSATPTTTPAAELAQTATRPQTDQTAQGLDAAAQGRQQQQQQEALAAAKAAEAAEAASAAETAALNASSALKAAAAAAAKGPSTTAPLQGQEADLASLASGAGLVITSNSDRPAPLPQSQLVSGAVAAQSADGEMAAAAASQDGDAADQFLGKGEAHAALANALDRMDNAADAAVTAKPFAAVVDAAAAGTNAARTAATNTPTAMAGLGAVGATHTASPTGMAPAVASARAPQAPPPVQQVSNALANAAAKGQDSISIQLTPDDLGRIDIHLDFSGDRVSAIISADRPETLEMLQKDSRNLERMLGESGLQTDHQSLSFSLRGQQNQNQQNAAREERSSRSRAQLLAFDDGGPAPVHQSRARTTVGGVDISV